jgi:predicted metal-dependent HD superfamily phosphohydrolase
VQQSADWARESVRAAGLAPEIGERIHALVMATRHDAVPASPDARLLVDVDLSILGAEPLRFDEYERQVRDEYAWVPGPVFRHERRRILEAFLARPRIYQTQHFYIARESRARANLERSIGAL